LPPFNPSRPASLIPLRHVLVCKALHPLIQSLSRYPHHNPHLLYLSSLFPRKNDCKVALGTGTRHPHNNHHNHHHKAHLTTTPISAIIEVWVWKAHPAPKTSYRYEVSTNQPKEP
jgi:hypothetical protein